METYKKGLVIIVIVALIASGAYFIMPNADNLEYHFKFTNLSLDTENTIYGDFIHINLEGTYQDAEVGNPLLPSYIANFVIPNNRNVKDIVVEKLNTITIPLEHRLYPKQPDMICSSDETIDLVINNETYQKNVSLLGKIYNNEGIQYLKGYPILTIRLYPIDYNPALNTIYYYETIVVKLTLDENSALTGNEFLRGDDISYYINNPEVLSTYKDIPLTEYEGGLCSPSETYKYVIITNNALKSSWIPLKEHRESFSNLTSIIVTVEDIVACEDYWNTNSTFNDSVARIREFCKDAYQDWKTEYVLIGGDWTDSKPAEQIVPVRVFDTTVAEDYHLIPSDLYYSNLEGTFWNEAQNCWGKNINANSDKTTELYIGRICAYNTTMVANAIYKIKWYDNYTNSSWLGICCFLGDNLGWGITSKPYMEELRTGTGSFAQYVGFEEFKEAHPDYDLNTLQYRFYYDDIGSQWKVDFRDNNLSNYSIVNHLGHSSYNSPLSLTRWYNYHSSRPFFAWSQGCLAGRFTSGLSGCEQVICLYKDSPAYAMVLNTGYGWGSYGSTAGRSQHQQKIFWNYFFKIKENNSEQWQLGKAKAYQNDWYISQTYEVYCWYSSTLFGDPAQTLKLKVVLNTIAIHPGHNYITYLWTNTTLKDISKDIGLISGEAVLVNISDEWYAWIEGFTPDILNKPVTAGNQIDIKVNHEYIWEVNG